MSEQINLVTKKFRFLSVWTYSVIVIFILLMTFFWLSDPSSKLSLESAILILIPASLLGIATTLIIRWIRKGFVLEESSDISLSSEINGIIYKFNNNLKLMGNFLKNNKKLVFIIALIIVGFLYWQYKDYQQKKIKFHACRESCYYQNYYKENGKNYCSSKCTEEYGITLQW